MIDFTQIILDEIYVHQVGNKLRDEGIKISNENISFAEEDTKSYLLKYFLSPFNNNEVYNFYHPSELDLNEIYVFIKRLFTNSDTLYESSIEISKHLYEKSTHPKINGGEFCICYFKNCLFDGVKADAIGFFKSEKKDVFLKFDSVRDNFSIRHENGVNVNKLDKGCLIFNLEESNGFKVCIIDSNKSKDTQYWKNDFLNIRPASDNYHFTKDFLSITKDYVTKQLNDDFEVSKADQIDLLNRSVDYFKTHETFDKTDFEKEVFQDSSVINSFRNFDESYRRDNEVELSDSFEISSQAVKKQARVFKSVLKLDKNFHIYIHGDRELIEQGVEKDGRKFYKIYYQDES
ncbi:MAG: nucleoid-associated protein [Bacteroidetes bacterium]|nr:MAG: nucleoid-associated protein [Bacteroidota bacterium]